MDQLYGVRWSQSFGNDPLGKYQNAEGQKNPRMDQWIDTFRDLSRDVMRRVVYQIRVHPKPRDFDGWMPDLQIVSSFIAMASGKSSAAPIRVPYGAWIGRVCDAYLIRIIADHGLFNQESLDQLTALNRRTKEKFIAMARMGELSEEGSAEEIEVIRNYLAAEHRKMTVTKMTPEQEVEARRQWQAERGLLQIRQRN